MEWREDHRFLKVAFPVNVHSPRATYEIQFGHTERPTHLNTSWDLARFEVCAQKWADLSEGDYGVALLNDNKYGHDIFGNVMRLSLLRAPTCPDPLADRGEHRFTYALLPHPGDFRAGGVVEQAYALNVPLRFTRAETAGTADRGELLPARLGYFTVDRPGVVMEAWKRAEREDAVVLRLYEAWGTRGTVTLANALGLRRAFACDLLERRETELPGTADGRVSFDVKPFQIITLLFPLGEG